MVSVNKYLLSPHCVLCLKKLDRNGKEGYWNKDVDLIRLDMVSTHQCFTRTREHLSMFFFFFFFLAPRPGFYNQVEFTLKGKARKTKKKKVPEECKNKMYIPGCFQTVHRNHYHVWIMTEIWTSQYWLKSSPFDSSDTLARLSVTNKHA